MCIRRSNDAGLKTDRNENANQHHDDEHRQRSEHHQRWGRFRMQWNFLSLGGEVSARKLRVEEYGSPTRDSFGK